MTVIAQLDFLLESESTNELNRIYSTIKKVYKDTISNVDNFMLVMTYRKMQKKLSIK